MWAPDSRKWSKDHTSLSKYFLERIKQQVDYEETISNRHKTTNGFTLVAEIQEVCKYTILRIKSTRRLQSVLEEANNEKLSSSIINDYILKKYFPDIVTYYKKLIPTKVINENNLINELSLNAQIHKTRLEEHYYNYIIQELLAIDYNSIEFKRNALLIDELVDCLIPFLLFKGYSGTSLSDIAYRYTYRKSIKDCAKKFLTLFNGQEQSYQFLIIAKTEYLEHDCFQSFLDSNKSLSYKINPEIPKSILPSKFKVDKKNTYFLINAKTIDPHNFLRTLYEKGLKYYIGSRERISLPFFSDYFSNAYWRFNRKESSFQSSNFNLDPLNVAQRGSTLRETLVRLAPVYNFKFEKEDNLPFIKAIKESVFYYNLALGSKSIENSLMLLWTSLETLVPYRFHDNDISNVQHFVSKTLCIGAIGRRIRSFASRLVFTNHVNYGKLNKLGTREISSFDSTEGLLLWLEWLNKEFDATNDPYDEIKNLSELLCKNFLGLNDTYSISSENKNTVSILQELINTSELSISYQLDRIYLHRNQIVHSGKFVNEYTNLWSHLEWYVGKLLSYVFIRHFTLTNNSEINKRDIFLELAADCDQIKNLLALKSKSSISSLNHEWPLILKHVWQFS